MSKSYFAYCGEVEGECHTPVGWSDSLEAAEEHALRNAAAKKTVATEDNKKIRVSMYGEYWEIREEGKSEVLKSGKA